MAGRLQPTTITATGSAGALTLACRHPDNRATVLIISANAGAQFQVLTSPDYLWSKTPSWAPMAIYDTNEQEWFQGTAGVIPQSYPYSYDVDMANRGGIQVQAVNSLAIGASVEIFTDNYYVNSPPLPGPAGPSGAVGPIGPSGPTGPSGPSG